MGLIFHFLNVFITFLVNKKITVSKSVIIILIIKIDVEKCYLKFVFDHHVKTRSFFVPCSWMLIGLGLTQFPSLILMLEDQ